MGRTEFVGPVFPAFVITRRSGAPVAFADGVVSENGLAMGPYIHGIFDYDEFRRAILDALRLRKGLPVLTGQMLTYSAQKEAAYDRLADLVRTNLDMAAIRRVMGLAL